ncbi:hypothetical protein BDD12DRAFT_888304 [Trichophaea hybrida]|nr:hypothetical protein BDD12DRAFT_888304 [Trichophaea hybrida]
MSRGQNHVAASSLSTQISRNGERTANPSGRFAGNRTANTSILQPATRGDPSSSTIGAPSQSSTSASHQEQHRGEYTRRLPHPSRSGARDQNFPSGSSSYYIPDDTANQPDQPGTSYGIDTRLLNDQSDTEDPARKSRMIRVPTGLDPTANCVPGDGPSNEHRLRRSPDIRDLRERVEDQRNLVNFVHELGGRMIHMGGDEYFFDDSPFEDDRNQASTPLLSSQDSPPASSPRQAQHFNGIAVIEEKKKPKIFTLLAKLVLQENQQSDSGNWNDNDWETIDTFSINGSDQDASSTIPIVEPVKKSHKGLKWIGFKLHHGLKRLSASENTRPNRIPKRVKAAQWILNKVSLSHGNVLKKQTIAHWMKKKLRRRIPSKMPGSKCPSLITICCDGNNSASISPVIQRQLAPNASPSALRTEYNGDKSASNGSSNDKSTIREPVAGGNSASVEFSNDKSAVNEPIIGDNLAYNELSNGNTAAEELVAAEHSAPNESSNDKSAINQPVPDEGSSRQNELCPCDHCPFYGHHVSEEMQRQIDENNRMPESSINDDGEEGVVYLVEDIVVGPSYDPIGFEINDQVWEGQAWDKIYSNIPKEGGL